MPRKIKNHFFLVYSNLLRMNFELTKTGSIYFYRLTHELWAKKTVTRNGEHQKSQKDKKRQTALYTSPIVQMHLNKPNSLECWKSLAAANFNNTLLSWRYFLAVCNNSTHMFSCFFLFCLFLQRKVFIKYSIFTTINCHSNLFT